MDEFRYDENLYNKISMNCLIMNMNINSIQQEIDKLNEYVNTVINDNKNIVEELQLQNVIFHKNILEKQLQQFKEVRVSCFNKIYADLFLLYNKIAEYLFELDKNFHAVEAPTEIYVAKYITKLNIIVYDETNMLTSFKINEIDDLYKHLINRFDDMKRYQKELDFLATQIKTNGRLKLFSQGMEVQGKKLYTELTVYYQALNSMLRNNMLIAEKYASYSSKIYNELTEIVIF